MVTIRWGEIAQPEPCTTRPQASPSILKTLCLAEAAGTAPGVGAGSDRSASEGMTGSGSNWASALSTLEAGTAFRSAGRISESLHVVAQAEHRLLHGNHGRQPHERDAEHRADGEPAGGIHRLERAAQQMVADLSGGGAGERLRDQTQHQRRDHGRGRQPWRGGPGGQQVRREPRADDRAGGEADQAERV